MSFSAIALVNCNFSVEEVTTSVLHEMAYGGWISYQWPFKMENVVGGGPVSIIF